MTVSEEKLKAFEVCVEARREFFTRLEKVLNKIKKEHNLNDEDELPSELTKKWYKEVGRIAEKVEKKFGVSIYQKEDSIIVEYKGWKVDENWWL